MHIETEKKKSNLENKEPSEKELSNGNKNHEKDYKISDINKLFHQEKILSEKVKDETNQKEKDYKKSEVKNEEDKSDDHNKQPRKQSYQMEVENISICITNIYIGKEAELNKDKNNNSSEDKTEVGNNQDKKISENLNGKPQEDNDDIQIEQKSPING